MHNDDRKRRARLSVRGAVWGTAESQSEAWVENSCGSLRGETTWSSKSVTRGILVIRIAKTSLTVEVMSGHCYKRCFARGRWEAKERTGGQRTEGDRGRGHNGQGDRRTGGQDRGTGGQGDGGTEGQGTGGQGGRGTGGQGDRGTEGQRDRGTGGQGDRGTRDRGTEGQGTAEKKTAPYMRDRQDSETQQYEVE